MSEKELNSYRFTSGEEPTDEMLRYVMKEVADDAARRQHEATEAYFRNMRESAERKGHVWNERVKEAINGRYTS